MDRSIEKITGAQRGGHVVPPTCPTVGAHGKSLPFRSSCANRCRGSPFTVLKEPPRKICPARSSRKVLTIPFARGFHFKTLPVVASTAARLVRGFPRTDEKSPPR